MYAKAGVSAEASQREVNAEADVAQLAERVLGKDEVTSSILVIGSILSIIYSPAKINNLGFRAP